jgi:anti-sigma B factor antagonist
VGNGPGADKVRTSSAVGSDDLEVVVSSLDTTHEVRLVGELDLSTAGLLREELDRLISDGARLVTLDLAELSFVDSTGLSVLIGALKQVRGQGGDIILRSPTPGTRKVLEITGLTEVFSIS